MAQHAVYRGRRAWIVDLDLNTGPLLDYGDGLTFWAPFGELDDDGEPLLVVDPTDGEWESASPLLDRLPGVQTAEDGTGYMVLPIES